MIRFFWRKYTAIPGNVWGFRCSAPADVVQPRERPISFPFLPVATNRFTVLRAGSHMWHFPLREGLATLSDPKRAQSRQRAHGWVRVQTDYVCQRLRGSWGQRFSGLGYLLTAATGWYSVG